MINAFFFFFLFSPFFFFFFFFYWINAEPNAVVMSKLSTETPLQLLSATLTKNEKICTDECFNCDI